MRCCACPLMCRFGAERQRLLNSRFCEPAHPRSTERHHRGWSHRAVVARHQRMRSTGALASSSSAASICRGISERRRGAFIAPRKSCSIPASIRRCSGANCATAVAPHNSLAKSKMNERREAILTGNTAINTMRTRNGLCEISVPVYTQNSNFS